MAPPLKHQGCLDDILTSTCFEYRVSLWTCVYLFHHLSTVCHAAAVKPQQSTRLSHFRAAALSFLLKFVFFSPQYEPAWYLHTPALLALWAEGVLAARCRPVQAPPALDWKKKTLQKHQASPEMNVSGGAGGLTVFVSAACYHCIQRGME